MSAVRRLDLTSYPRKTKKAVVKALGRGATGTVSQRGNLLGFPALGPRERDRVARVVRKTRPRPVLLPKSKWGPGPWQGEPDFLAFEHGGLSCAIFRNMWVTGSLNGYVMVPPTHPWWGKGYNECIAVPQCEPEYYKGAILARMEGEPYWDCAHRPDSIIEVHGGLTYGGPPPKVMMIKDANCWGFGFDTGHFDDFTPMMEATLTAIMDPRHMAERAKLHEAIKGSWMEPSYKDLAYVQHEVEQLAEQLAMIKAVEGP